MAVLHKLLESVIYIISQDVYPWNCVSFEGLTSNLNGTMNDAHLKWWRVLITNTLVQGKTRQFRIP